MPSLLSRSAALFVAGGLVAVAIAPACGITSACGGCNQSKQYCLGMAETADDCEPQYKCVDIPPKCKVPPTCECLIGDSNPPGRVLSCGFNQSIGFTVVNQASQC